MTIAGLHLSTGYLLALGLTLVIEVPVVAAFYPGRRLRMALVCAIATTATHLMLVFGFPRLLPRGVPTLWIGELCATLAEAGAYWLAARQPGRALVVSAVANSLSFGAGMVLFG
jgi:hypothetical protein